MTKIRDKLLKALSTKHEKIKKPDVMLNWVTLVGTMQSGKSTTAEALISMVNKEYEDKEQINLKFDKIQEIFKLHLASSDLLEDLRETDLINILIDDAVIGSSSKSYRKEDIVNWFTIRHYFADKLKVAPSTLNIFFCTQRYMNLQNILRQAPILIFKALPVVDISEKKLLATLLGRGKWRYLNKWCNEIFIKGNIEYMSYNLIKILGSRTFILRIKPRDVEFDKRAKNIDKHCKQLKRKKKVEKRIKTTLSERASKFLENL